MSQSPEEEAPAKSAARIAAESAPLSPERIAEMQAAAEEADPVRSAHVRRTLKMADLYKKAIATNPGFIDAVTAMITLRRAYSVAFHELIASVGEGGKDEEMLLDYAIQFAMYKAGLPFDEREMLHVAITEVFPWFAHLSNLRIAAAKERELAEGPEREARRRASPVPIAVYTDDTQNHPHINRERSLVLVGWRPAVWFLAHMAYAEATNNNMKTLHFAAESNPKPAQGPMVAEKKWYGGASNGKKFEALMKGVLGEFNVFEWDLLVFDDLTKASVAGFVGQDPAAVAGNTQKHIRSWATKHGAAVVACLPQDEMVTDITGPAYEQLRTFTNLRQVVTTKQDNYYVIAVGSAEPLYVAVDVVDAYAKSKLILPAGVQP